MKPKNGIEMLTPAWNRYVDTWKFTRKTTGDMPMRLRGYSELAMSDIQPKERKQIHSAVTRGYKLARSNRASMLLQLLSKTVDYTIGYVGKTNAYIWLPTTEMRDDCMRHLEAQTVMTDKFNANKSIRIYNANSFNVWINTSGYNASQLKAYLTEARLVFDEHMELWADQRRELADRIMDDDYVCRVPFDSRGD